VFVGSAQAPRPSTGPHKLRECLPLCLLLRNRLKYALTGREVTRILMQKLIKVDNKVRTDNTYPAGFMDVISIAKTNENYRLLYDVKGRFAVHKILPGEAKFKLCRVRHQMVGAKGVPYIVTHDARTIRYPNPDIKVNDTIKIALSDSKILEHIKFQVGNLCMIVGGRNLGRVGIVQLIEKHPGSFHVVHIKDAAGNSFATRLQNVFIIGKGTKSLVSLPRRKGIKKSLLEEREVRSKKFRGPRVPLSNI
jgi:small subunit ribosomal protein S4e